MAASIHPYPYNIIIGNEFESDRRTFLTSNSSCTVHTRFSDSQLSCFNLCVSTSPFVLMLSFSHFRIDWCLPCAHFLLLCFSATLFIGMQNCHMTSGRSPAHTTVHLVLVLSSCASDGMGYGYGSS